MNKIGQVWWMMLHSPKQTVTEVWLRGRAYAHCTLLWGWVPISTAHMEHPPSLSFPALQGTGYLGWALLQARGFIAITFGFTSYNKLNRAYGNK